MRARTKTKVDLFLLAVLLGGGILAFSTESHSILLLLSFGVIVWLFMTAEG